MRFRTAATLSVVSCTLGAALVACFDVLHSTSGILTSCRIDASAAGCLTGDGSVPESICATDAVDARLQASHACAWLGACETPLGNNAFGPCMVQALMAFDCKANPNHRVKGEAARLWGCLRSPTSCADVNACLFPNGVSCGHGDYLGCGGGAARIECRDGGFVRGEDCALWGQACEQGPSGAVCTGTDAGSCLQSGSTCDIKTSLIRCGTDGGGPLVIDCASFGTQHCSAFPTTSAPAWVACVGEAPPGVDAACFPDKTATCVDGVAVSCPSGVTESLDCAALLGSPAACVPGPLDPPFDWTSACRLTPLACSADTCDGGALVGCARGAEFSFDCSDAGLGPCSVSTIDGGFPSTVACTPP